MATKTNRSRGSASKGRSTSKRGATKSTARKGGTSSSTAKKATSRKTTARKSTARTSTGTRSGAGRGSEFSQAQMTTDHDVIRRWVEERGGYPATVSATAITEDAGVLRIDYPGFSGEGTLERISWQEWFDKFDDEGLVFLYQEETADGGPSRFSKLISAQEAAGRQGS